MLSPPRPVGSSSACMSSGALEGCQWPLFQIFECLRTSVFQVVTETAIASVPSWVLSCMGEAESPNAYNEVKTPGQFQKDPGNSWKSIWTFQVVTKMGLDRVIGWLIVGTQHESVIGAHSLPKEHLSTNTNILISCVWVTCPHLPDVWRRTRHFDFLSLSLSLRWV